MNKCICESIQVISYTNKMPQSICGLCANKCQNIIQLIDSLVKTVSMHCDYFYNVITLTHCNLIAFQ